MEASNENKSLTDSLLMPLYYVYLGFLTVFGGIVNILRYIALGSYYALYYSVLSPFSKLGASIEDSVYAAGSKKKGKDKELKLDISMDSKEAENKGSKKDIYTQMMENQKKALIEKNKKAISPQMEKKLKTQRDSLLKSITDGQEKRYDKPKTFKYRALNPDGKIEESTFIGVSKLDIYTFLTGEGYTVYSIETSDWINFVHGQSKFSINQKLSTKDLIFFITQLSTYLKSGITLTEAMRILEKQLSKKKSQHRMMQSIVYYLTMGESFSKALEHQNSAFPPLVINMIKAAEAAGNLDEVLDDLGNYYTEIDKTRKQMITAMSYPAFVGLFSLVIIVVILIKIVPQFVGIYESAGAELNPLTVFVINASNFITKYVVLILLLLGIIGFIFFMSYKEIKPFRVFVQTLMMKVPIMGKIIIYNELTIFTKTFASLLKNDVFITDSINILSKITNNEIYRDIMYGTIENIAKGEKISESFKNHWAIPDIAYYMIVTGENTGELAEMMQRVSNYYQEQHSVIVNSLKSLIEPVMIIFLAIVVGGILIAVILPMFYLYNSISL